MTPIDLAFAVGAFLLAASVGVVVHEFAHAAVLRTFGIPHRMEWLPRGDDRASLGAVAAGAFARVTPLALPADCPPWRLRLAAMAPLSLLAPFALVGAGVVADPFAAGNPMVRMVALGWLACAVPSPGDFSLLFHAAEAIGRRADGGETAEGADATSQEFLAKSG